MMYDNGGKVEGERIIIREKKKKSTGNDKNTPRTKTKGVAKELIRTKQDTRPEGWNHRQSRTRTSF